MLVMLRASRLGGTLASAAVVLAIAPGFVLAAATRQPAIPDVTKLFGRAVQIVRGTSRPKYARAVVLEADGYTRGGKKVTSATGVVKWRFVFDNQSSGSRFASATIFYGPPPAKFGRVRGNRSPFVEDVRIPRAPKMTLAEAVARLKQGGFTRGFSNVTLRNPLGPKRLHPLYIFGIGGGEFVAVDTVTKKVGPFG
jgi:hypothetical protein